MLTTGGTITVYIHYGIPQCLHKIIAIMKIFYNASLRPVIGFRGADKSLARPGRKQARKHVRRRARFQQHRDAICYQVFFSCKARRRRKFTPF